ncbi:MAG: AraC family transcriptional regulator [Bacteroidetes bacterium]|nr:AraC family transcriptional regulator [Bacteroidota bacterium]
MGGKNVVHSHNPTYYSDLLGISGHHFNLLCKKYFGKTAKEYIEGRLVNKAKDLLIRKNNSIKEVSYLLGFKTSSQFVKFFKKHFQISPKNFQKRKAF